MKKIFIIVLTVLILIGISVAMFVLLDYPTIAPNNSWYKSETLSFSDLREIDIVKKYKPTGNEIEIWNADVENVGDIKCYIIDNKVIIAGNGSGKIITNEDASGMFRDGSNLFTINGMGVLKTNKTKDMSNMFYNCQSIIGLDVSKFNTTNVESMSNMFYNCQNITELDVSKFNTKNVEDMSNMFYNCKSLTELDVNNFDTTDVINMSNMFYRCRSLTKLDVSNFNTTNVEDMSNMFYNCQNITKLDLSKFNTTNVKDMSNMFCKCQNMTELNLSNFNTIKVSDMTDMFKSCDALKTVKIGEKFSLTGDGTTNCELNETIIVK